MKNKKPLTKLQVYKQIDEAFEIAQNLRLSMLDVEQDQWEAAHGLEVEFEQSEFLCELDEIRDILNTLLGELRRGGLK